jgi:hypothetical protein
MTTNLTNLFFSRIRTCDLPVYSTLEVRSLISTFFNWKLSHSATKTSLDSKFQNSHQFKLRLEYLQASHYLLTIILKNSSGKTRLLRNRAKLTQVFLKRPTNSISSPNVFLLVCCSVHRQYWKKKIRSYK